MLPAPIHANEADRIESLRRTPLRSYDILGRFDPTEFIAILPDADAVLASELAERIRMGMDAPFLVGEEVVELTVRVGVASADFVSYTPPVSELADAARADLAAKAVWSVRRPASPTEGADAA